MFLCCVSGHRNLATASPQQASPPQPPLYCQFPLTLGLTASTYSTCAQSRLLTSAGSPFFLTDRLVTTVSDLSGTRVLFSWVVPDDYRASLWHGISSVRCKQCLGNVCPTGHGSPISPRYHDRHSRVSPVPHRRCPPSWGATGYSSSHYPQPVDGLLAIYAE